MKTTYRRPETQQFLCLVCGFQSGKIVFIMEKNEEDRPVVKCPDCDSLEIVDADSKVRINPPGLK